MECDECGCVVTTEEFQDGATRVLVEPDSDLSVETYETMCALCAKKVAKEEAAKKKAESRKKIEQRCASCFEYKTLVTNRHCIDCAKLRTADDSSYENQLRKQMGLLPKGIK